MLVKMCSKSIWEYKMVQPPQETIGSFLQTKHNFTIKSSNHVPWYLLKLTEKLRYTQKLAHRYFQHHYLQPQKLGSNQDVFQVDEGINKLCRTAWKSISGSYKLRKSNRVMFWKRQN